MYTSAAASMPLHVLHLVEMSDHSRFMKLSKERAMEREPCFAVRPCLMSFKITLSLMCDEKL